MAGGRGGTFSVLARLRGASRISVPYPRGEGGSWGLFRGPGLGCGGGGRGAQLGWALHWRQDELTGLPGEVAGESGRESGKWSFLARIKREGRVRSRCSYLVGSPFLGGEGGGGGLGGNVQLGECSILPWSGQSEGYEA